MELLLKIDGKGRILIPANIRKKMGLEHLVKVRIEDNKLIIEPVRDPIETLTRAVIRGSRDIEEEISSLRVISEKEGLKRIRERWS
ncbi:MAG: AbrB/MazE/SpoVT family DNA-binding domain-containing protein [Thermoprotei archaeon]|nr:MAG: AbrB/MazE/SpoVT family DNA-binding domain-containing protein [Thermoprotei archaeon]RLF18429.1 MAG: AbrB/MazE/SpoVT family DNA-binding domain-containing protein [Thermoprotei archaeon]